MGVIKKFMDYLTDESPAQIELRELIESTLEKSFINHHQPGLSYSKLVGMVTAMSKELETALVGRTHIYHNQERNYSYLACNKIVEKWLKQNHLNAWRDYEYP